MAVQVNLNADIAEGWGAYDIGNDAAMMDIVTSANVACGMHAGDANTMHRLVMLARERGVSIGAHPGFNKGRPGDHPASWIGNRGDGRPASCASCISVASASSPAARPGYAP